MLTFGDFEVSDVGQIENGIYRVTIMFRGEYVFDVRSHSSEVALAAAIAELKAHLNNALVDISVYESGR